MQRYRTARWVASLIFIGALIYFLVGIVLTILVASGGIGSGWGQGWRGWFLIPALVNTFLSAVVLLMVGAVLFFLIRIEENLRSAPTARGAVTSGPSAGSAAKPFSTTTSLPGAAASAAAARTGAPDVRVSTPKVEARPPETESRLPGSQEAARVAAELRALKPQVEAGPLAAPAQATTPMPVSQATAADDLEAIAGVGAVYARRLREAGITTFAALAAASDEVLEKVTQGNLERIVREDWRGQARRLSK